MVPDRLLVHEVTVVQPVEGTDDYNNVVYDYGIASTRRAITAWLQQDTRREQFRDGRDPLDERWLMVTNDPDVVGVDRIEWDDHPRGSATFEVDGPPEPVYTPAGFHHAEITLRITEG